MTEAFVLVLAALPTALYSILLWRLDRYEKEPWSLLVASFIWGALPALVIAVVIELGLGSLSWNVLGPDTHAQLIAPVVEEPLKALALIGLFRWARREFNGVTDGIIYGALVGFGFAMSENVLYLWTHQMQLFEGWLVRSIVFGFNHALFTSIVGIALGWVRHDRRRWMGYASLPAALLLAITLHSLHNTSVMQGLLGYCLAIVIDGGGLLIVLTVAVLAQRQEQQWLLTYLPEERMHGVLDDHDLERVAHPAIRVRAEAHVLLHNGIQAYRHLHHFHHLLCELAFLKHQFVNGDRGCCSDDVDKLRASVQTQRARVARWLYALP